MTTRTLTLPNEILNKIFSYIEGKHNQIIKKELIDSNDFWTYNSTLLPYNKIANQIAHDVLKYNLLRDKQISNNKVIEYNKYFKYSVLHLNRRYVFEDIKFGLRALMDDFNYYNNYYNYTKILNQIQGISINRAYIWGKSYKCGKDEINFMNNLGTIDYDTIDKKSVEDTESAINWLHYLHSNYDNIVIKDEPELFPNMKQNTFNKDKRILNQDIDDITTIWYCGIKKRKIAHAHNIFSWRDSRLTAELMGFKNKQATIINNILEINRQEEHKIKIVNKIRVFNTTHPNFPYFIREI